MQRVVQTVRVPVVALRELGCLHEIVGGEEAGDHGVVQAAVHVDDLQVGVVLVAGEAAVEPEGVCEFTGFAVRKHGPVGVGLHVAPRVEVQRTYHLPAAVGDVGVAAETVGMHVVHTVNAVAAHADGGEAVCAIDVVVMVFILKCHLLEYDYKTYETGCAHNRCR